MNGSIIKENIERVINLFLFVASGILVIGYFKSGLPGDVLVNVGSVRQSRFYGSFPESILQVWDLRGIINKIFIYCLDLLSLFFIVSNNYVLTFKIFYFLTILGTCCLVILFLNKSTLNINRISLFLITFITLMSCSNSFVIGQSEFSSVLLCLIMVCFFLRSEKILHFYLVGLLGALVFGFKGSTLLIAISALFAASALSNSNPRKKLFFTLTFLVSNLILFLLVLKIFAPQEIQDFEDAIKYQDSFSISILGKIKILVFSFLTQWPHVPIVMVGLIVFIIELSRNTNAENRKYGTREKYIFLSFLIGSISILIQAKGFGYHLVSLIPCVFSILLIGYKSVISRVNLKSGLVIISLVSLVILPTKTNIFINLNRMYAFQISSADDSINLKYKANFASYQRLKVQVEERCGLNILFLDAGIGAFFLNNKSYLRQTYPLALQRRSGQLVDSNIRKYYLREIDNFNEKCILIDRSWFIMDNQTPWLDSFNLKIVSNYRIIERVQSNGSILELLEKSN